MFHANGWIFTWMNTARGMANICLRGVEPRLIYKLIEGENVTMLCAAPTVLISIVNAPAELRKRAPRGVRLFSAGAPPAAATIALVEREFGWDLTQVYGLTETHRSSPSARPGRSIETCARMRWRGSRRAKASS
jgi:fatty-acyl-CoA synthase